MTSNRNDLGHVLAGMKIQDSTNYRRLIFVEEIMCMSLVIYRHTADIASTDACDLHCDANPSLSTPTVGI